MRISRDTLGRLGRAGQLGQNGGLSTVPLSRALRRRDSGTLKGAKGRREEDSIQRAVFAHIRLRGVPGLVALHVPNGGYRRKTEARILKGLGVTAGTPDVLAWHDGMAFAMEIKAESGRVTDAQLEMLNRLSEAGVFTAICHGLDRALAVLEAWKLLRGRCG